MYDTLGNKLNSYVQKDNQNPSFGVFDDRLKPGDYDIVFVATAAPYPTSSSAYNRFIDSSYLIQKMSINSDGSGQRDVFTYKNRITMGLHDTTFAGIQLSRLSGHLEVRLLDHYISDSTFFAGSIWNAPGSYKVYNDKHYQSSWDSIPRASAPLLSAFCFGSDRNLDIHLQMWRGDRYYTTVVKNVKIHPNKRTILTGKIDASSSVTSTISIDTSFSGTIYQSF